MSTIGTLALPLVKSRMNRLPSDTSLDNFLGQIIASAERDLQKQTGTLDEADADDLMLLVDYSEWRYKNRDQSGGMPDWLRYRIRCRFIRIRSDDA